MDFMNVWRYLILSEKNGGLHCEYKKSRGDGKGFFIYVFFFRVWQIAKALHLCLRLRVASLLP